MKKAISLFMLAITIVLSGIVANPIKAEAAPAVIGNKNLKPKISLDVEPYFQNTDWSCSGASCMVVLNYFNSGSGLDDVDLTNETETYIYRMKDAINKYLGSKDYNYVHASKSSIGTYIENSLYAGNPVIARVAFSAGYFNYKSTGHLTVVTGLYTDSNNATWLEITDSFVNRFSANNYSDSKTGKVYIPLSEFVNYTYSGDSSMYLIYSTVERYPKCNHQYVYKKIQQLNI